MADKIYIFSNKKDYSNQVQADLEAKLKANGFEILPEYSDEADALLCIGGDGTFLSFVHKCGFPSAPILGVNTGHLGFFQEAYPTDLDSIVNTLINKDYKIQLIKPLKATIVTDKNSFTRIGINEVLIRGLFSHITQFSVSIDDTKVQEFSGDGILVSTPAGSTAYNYSLDGSLVAPELDVLQITPVAPMNTNAYRSFHSSLILPADKTVTIEGIGRSTNGTIIVSFDGRTHEFNHVKRVLINQSEEEISLVRFKDFNYWNKLSSKLL